MDANRRDMTHVACCCGRAPTGGPYAAAAASKLGGREAANATSSKAIKTEPDDETMWPFAKAIPDVKRACNRLARVAARPL